VSPEASALCDAIRAKHGAAVAAVVFYGSCLRRSTAEGVHDFYVVVDDYAAAYASRWLARVNAWLPPNVFYIETRLADVTLRAKYAVVSRADLERGCRGETLRCGLWARFAQPVVLAWVRDERDRQALAAACADAVCTAVRVGVAARGAGWQAPSSPDLWRDVFRATYASELRPEREGASDALYAEQSERFDARLALAVDALVEAGAVERSAEGDGSRMRARERRVPLPHPLLGKPLAALQLLKTGLTFGDWVPYALWKLERHSGVRLEASERQRRHPFLFAWPLVLRALRSGALR